MSQFALSSYNVESVGRIARANSWLRLNQNLRSTQGTRVMALVLALVSASVAGAQCKLTPSDTIFAPDGLSPGERYGYTAVSSAANPPPPNDSTTITINRVVGPGTPSEFDGNGFLTATSLGIYVQNGVLSDTAWLDVGPITLVSLVGGSYDLTGHMVSIYLNDQINPVYSNAYPLPSCVPIPTRYLKFAQRNPGQAPTPGVNKIAITLDAQDWFDAGEYNFALASIGNLTIKAMAPVVMVHGWHSGPWWWGPSPSRGVSSVDPDGCGFDADYPRSDYIDGSFNFIQAFVSAKIPFSCAVQVNNKDSVPDGGGELETRIPSAAAEFGAQHVHLIGHSKGGLWIRAALPWLADNGPAVYSVTTIDTPHHGSSLADLLVQAHKYPLLGLFNPKLFLGLFSEYDAGADDLQTTEAGRLISQYPNPTSPPLHFTVDGMSNVAQYYSVAADADVNANGKIDANEWFPYHYAPTDLVNGWIENYRYNFLGNVQSVTVNTTTLFGRTVPLPPHFQSIKPFQKNDLSVTVNSAQFDGFLPVVPDTSYSGSIPYFLFNHKTVGDPGIAQKLIVLFQSAEAPAQQ